MCFQMTGGFVMTIYSASTGEATTLTARETAPAAATEDMFHGNPELSKKGPLAIAVPGQVIANKLQWNDNFSKELTWAWFTTEFPSN